MNFADAIKSGFSNYVNFEGRASRSALWYWVLFTILVSIAAQFIDGMIFPAMEVGPIYGLWGLATLLPGISVSVRRLHDVDRTGWWLLLGFTIIGGLVLLYWFIIKGTTGANRFGPDPVP